MSHDSTPRAIEWDESFKNRADPSGRAIASVHDSAYQEGFTPQAAGTSPARQGIKRKGPEEPHSTVINGTKTN